MYVLFKLMYFFFKTWKGSVGDRDYKTEVFSPFVLAQYIRLHPTDCFNQCAFRLEIYGCNVTSGTCIQCTHACNIKCIYY